MLEYLRENPIDLIPLEEATDSNGNPLWDTVEEDGDRVTVIA